VTPNRRKSDPGYRKIALVDALSQLRFLWWILGIFFVAFGFNFKTPAQHFKDIELKTDSVSNKLDSRMTAVEQQHESIEHYLGALTIALCIDRPRRDTMLMQLPCDSLLKKQQH
jgi:hypothetical protein